MTDLDKNKKQIAAVQWIDASLDRLTADYDCVTLDVTEAEGRKVQVVVSNHVTTQWVGHWDENIIEGASLFDSSSLLDDSLKNVMERYGVNPEPGGGTRELNKQWFHLKVQFIDGAHIDVMGQQFIVSHD